ARAAGADLQFRGPAFAYGEPVHRGPAKSYGAMQVARRKRGLKALRLRPADDGRRVRYLAADVERARRGTLGHLQFATVGGLVLVGGRQRSLNVALVLFLLGKLAVFLDSGFQPRQ